jgi:hypothetical protein
LASSVLFRKKSLRFETSCRYSGDWVALIEQSAGGVVACARERLSFWRMHDNNTFTASPKQRAEEIRVRRAIATSRNRWIEAGHKNDQVKRGLGMNALNLTALYLSFGCRGRAIAAGMKAFALGTHRNAAVKRTLAALLPLSVVRNRFAAAGFPELEDVNQKELLSLLDSQMTLDFRLWLPE